MSDVTDSTPGADWQACGVATIGGAVGGGIAVSFFEFRSQQANSRATFLFIGAGIGFGGDLGGGVAPDPGSIIHNQNPDLWTSLNIGNGPWSANDLNLSYAALCQITVAGAYGYSLCSIQGGWARPLFDSTNVSGWTVGVGAVGSMMAGIWKQLGTSSTYY